LAPISLVIGGAGPKTLALVARHATWWNLPLGQIDRLDQLREQTGSARVSIQMMVALVPDEAQREQVTQVATRRFGVYGDGLVIASAAELVERFGDLAQRGVERTYVWFADFARDTTLEQFGSDVIGHIASPPQPPTAN
jgi:alkanesulfonate monooxygenase SsuD/methylene tetrahydromethanopterin reductase-like flavin-dependent oxidoreductase (luciferase family)